ncbi:ubiquitin family protein [Adhaeretor mobilis]|uniref:Secreted protein n=1 Tax=Adhaeretor mobilis TaxID=1930276 RepID=A0A517MTA9_9BACT|nr:hypothetical protein [Adhaeretor mobilis]QDS98116.1 hypothetical protein HG15A2_13880 [Adhaeretor mobilis]
MLISRFSAFTLFLLMTLGCFASATLQAAEESGDQFRIETDVYVGDEQEPVSRSVTIFEKEAVYDFSGKPAEVVVYRNATKSHPGEFILLNSEKQQRTDVPLEDITPLMKKLAKWASEQNDPVMQFSANPAFQEGFSKDTGKLSMRSPQWSYEVLTTNVENPAALARYREFTDWYARLNCMLHQTPPPGPRLLLNEQFVKHQVVPEQISRRIAGQDVEIHAKHLFSWRLSREDQARLTEARQQLASYKKVETEEFFRR